MTPLAGIFAPLSGAFGARAAVELVLVGAACGAVGVWVLQFGRAMLAESFTHALLPGLVVAALLSAGLIVGGLIGVTVAYALLLAASRAPKTSTSSANSVTVTTLVAAGALLASRGNGVASFESLLFGDPLAASDGDIATAAALAIAIALALRLLHERFAALAFDPGAASSLGVSTALVSAAALALLALSTAISANVAGSLLALAFITGPALGAAALTSRLGEAIALSAIAGAVCGVAGLYLSYYADWPASASIAMIICLWTACAAAAAPLPQLIRKPG